MNIERSFAADIFVFHKDALLCDLLASEARLCGYKVIVFVPNTYADVIIPSVRLIISDIAAEHIIQEKSACQTLWISDSSEHTDKNSCCSPVYTLKRPFLLSEYREILKKALECPIGSPYHENTLPYFNQDGKTAIYCGQKVLLTPNEIKILKVLLENSGKTVSRSEISQILGENGSNIVDVYICYLRKKFYKISPLKIIHSVRDRGYTIGNLIE